MPKLKWVTIKSFWDSQLNSYSQIFFSSGKWYGLGLLLVSFFVPMAGLLGFMAVATANISALMIGLDKGKIKAGFYGFNSILIGVAFGTYYSFDFALLLVIIFASVLTLFATVLFEGFFTKYGLPYLSFSFLFVIWTVTLATKNYHNLNVSETGVYQYNDLVSLGGSDLLKIYIWFSHLPWLYSFSVYLKSLGAIFFQYDVYAGLVLMILLFFQSRISWFLSLVGFYAAWYFYQLMGIELTHLDYGNIGFNYILTAIAIGGIFIVPSWYSFISVVLLVPLIAFLITGLSGIFAQFGLSIYALPFNIVTILYLYSLKFRNRNFTKPQLVLYQLFSAEEHVYGTENYKERFKDEKFISLSLPFFGKWKVNQAFDGEHTHKGEWRFAWDFVIDQDGKVFKDSGDFLTDYYCYNKPVIMPADGFVEIIVNGVPDNIPGQVNLKQNWGNTIVLRHSNYLFTKISHIRPDSFQVKEGQFVRKGEILAYVGNSGRSPYPHLHFQVQETSFIGSKTIQYPFALYFSGNTETDLKRNSYPVENEIVENVKTEEILKNNFDFKPGRKILFEIISGELTKEKSVEWEVKVNYFNQTYLECKNTGAIAYFVETDNQLYFTAFYGSKQSYLFYFYLAVYRLVLGQINKLEINDFLPVHQTTPWFKRITQDLISPFFIYIKPAFSLQYHLKQGVFDIESIVLKSCFKNYIFKIVRKQILFEIHISGNGFDLWTIETKHKRIELKQAEEN